MSQSEKERDGELKQQTNQRYSAKQPPIVSLANQGQSTWLVYGWSCVMNCDFVFGGGDKGDQEGGAVDVVDMDFRKAFV